MNASDWVYREEGGGVGDVVAHLPSGHDPDFILLNRRLLGLPLLYSDVTIHLRSKSLKQVKTHVDHFRRRK